MADCAFREGTTVPPAAATKCNGEATHSVTPTHEGRRKWQPNIPKMGDTLLLCDAHLAWFQKNYSPCTVVKL